MAKQHALEPTQSNINTMLIITTSHIRKYYKHNYTSSQYQNENQTTFNLIFPRQYKLKWKTITLNHNLTYNMILKQHEAACHPYVIELNMLHEIVKPCIYMPWNKVRTQ